MTDLSLLPSSLFFLFIVCLILFIVWLQNNTIQIRDKNPVNTEQKVAITQSQYEEYIKYKKLYGEAVHEIEELESVYKETDNQLHSSLFKTI